MKNNKVETENLQIGKFGLVQQDSDGRIQQIGLNENQSQMLQVFVVNLSLSEPLVRMGSEFELVLLKDISKR